MAAVETEGTELTAGLRALLRSGIVALAGVGAGAVFLILGVAGVALKSQCGDSASGLCADAAIVQAADDGITADTDEEINADAVDGIVADGSTAVPELVQRPAMAAAEGASARAFALPSPRETALRTAESLIDGTFALVENADAGPASAEAQQAAAVTGTSPAEPERTLTKSAVEAPAAIAKRSVTSVPVDGEGRPIWSTRTEVASAASNAAAEMVEGRGPGDGPEPGVDPLAFAAAVAETPPQPQTRPKTASLPAPAAEAVTAETAGERPRVGGSPVNVRASPDRDAARLFVLAAGADIRATHAERGWVRVVAEGDRAGWVYGTYLVGVETDALPAAEGQVAAVAPEAEPAPQAAAASDVRTVRGQGVNVRANPSGDRLFALAGGTEVRVTGTERGWVRITDPQGRSGWVYARYLSGG